MGRKYRLPAGGYPLTWSGLLARAYRPCGACGSMIPADTGCKHWKPRSTTGSTRQPTYVSRARQRELEKAAREKARASVENFLRGPSL